MRTYVVRGTTVADVVRPQGAHGCHKWILQRKIHLDLEFENFSFALFPTETFPEEPNSCSWKMAEKKVSRACEQQLYGSGSSFTDIRFVIVCSISTSANDQTIEATVNRDSKYKRGQKKSKVAVKND